jgi:hypothetical protein
MPNSHVRPVLSLIRIPAFIATISLLLTCAVFAAPGNARADELGRPVGRVTMVLGQGGFILGASGGKGTLVYKGRTYAFKFGGLGIGQVGVSKVTAVGEVYRLQRVADFPGAYAQARAEYAVVEGKGAQWLENSNGVVMKLRSTTKGLSFTLGAEGLKVEMGPMKKSRPQG